MSTVPKVRKKKLLLPECLLIAYILIGAALAGYCLSFSGEERFTAFASYGIYATPTSYIISWAGLGEAMFSDWPAAIYWTMALVVVNGLAIYGLSKALHRLWCRSTSP